MTSSALPPTARSSRPVSQDDRFWLPHPAVLWGGGVGGEAQPSGSYEGPGSALEVPAHCRVAAPLRCGKLRRSEAPSGFSNDRADGVCGPDTPHARVTTRVLAPGSKERLNVVLPSSWYCMT